MPSASRRRRCGPSAPTVPRFWLAACCQTSCRR
ncbi:hypothetical protein R2601_02888 [Salipiger bermudensis HTCC2601]|uniref:Uncharacterized protein n=1 Tax=Salipiger bermudensis (strain DSM 26914 / JCM 13377 / KCTC 12554 / HTCC2601) TaxID=314265 RepID=Q0FWR8_SALBH|nr:hypothetical protein R2601_02888 [Salipiger bermudensis HTCC2601]